MILKKKNPFIRVLVSLVLVAVFAIPIGIELLKSIGEHKHNACTETSFHFHQEPDSCLVCHFNFSPFQLNLDSEPYTVYHFYSEKKLSNYIDNVSSSYSENYFSRGPPNNS